MRLRTFGRTAAMLAALLTPAVALARGPALSLGADPVRGLVGTTLGLALGFWFFATLLGLMLEAFGKAPTAPRDYGGAMWRALLVLFLLWNYQTIFSSVAITASSTAQRIAPDNAFKEFQNFMDKKMATIAARHATEDAKRGPTTAGLVGGLTDAAQKLGNFQETFGGYVFNALMTILILVGMLAHWVLGQIANIMIALFYIVGPLALVWAIPRGSGSGGKWFGGYVTFCCWPIISGIILRLVTATTATIETTAPKVNVNAASLVDAVQVSDTAVAFATSFVLIATALAVPKIAGAFVSGAAQNFAAPGMHSLADKAKDYVSGGVNRVKDFVGGSSGDGPRPGGERDAEGGMGMGGGLGGQERATREPHRQPESPAEAGMAMNAASYAEGARQRDVAEAHAEANASRAVDELNPREANRVPDAGSSDSGMPQMRQPLHGAPATGMATGPGPAAERPMADAPLAHGGAIRTSPNVGARPLPQAAVRAAAQDMTARFGGVDVRGEPDLHVAPREAAAQPARVPQLQPDAVPPPAPVAPAPSTEASGFYTAGYGGSMVLEPAPSAPSAPLTKE